MSETPSKGYILSARKDRLGGRLISLFHGIRLAQQFDLPYRVSWPDFHDFEINNYEELFSQSYIEQQFVGPDEDDDPSVQTLNTPMDEAIAQRVRDGLVLKIDAAKFPIDQRSTDGFDFFGSIGFHPDIVEQMNKIENVGSFDALHLRYGDLLSADRVYSMAIPIEYYIDFLDNFDFESKNLILFGDNPDLQEHLATLYPVVLAGNAYDDANLTDLQRALMDIYLLSSADSITMGGTSNFSILAASLAGKPRNSLRRKADVMRKARTGQKIITRLGSGDTTFKSILGDDLPFHSANFFLTEHDSTPLEKTFLARNVYQPAVLADMPKFAKIDRLLMALDPCDPADLADLYAQVRPAGHTAPERLYGDFDQDAVLDLIGLIAGQPDLLNSTLENALAAAREQYLLYNNRQTLRPSALMQSEILGRWMLNCCADSGAVFKAPIWKTQWPVFDGKPNRFYLFNTLPQFKTFFLIVASALTGCFNSAKHLNMNALPWADFDDIVNGMDDLDPNAQFIVMAAWMATHCHRKDPEMHAMVAALRERHGAVLSRLVDHCTGLDNRFGKNLERIQNMGL